MLSKYLITVSGKSITQDTILEDGIVMNFPKGRTYFNRTLFSPAY